MGGRRAGAPRGRHAAERQGAPSRLGGAAMPASRPSERRRQVIPPIDLPVAGASADPAAAYRRVDDGSGYRPVDPTGARKRGKKGGRGPWRVVFWVALVVLVAALVALGVLIFSYWQAQDGYDKIAEEAFEAPVDIESAPLADITVDWDALRAINPDVVGWVYIPGTMVNYPIVHTDNDDHYLQYDFNGQRGWGATFGTIFLQAANSADLKDANNIIYGHHMRNGSMFALIAQLTDQAKFNENRTVYLLTPEGNYKLRTFSLVHCAADDPLAQVSFADEAERTAYIQDKIDRSVVQPEGDSPSAESIDHSFAFVTCDSLPTDGRYVLYSYVEETTVPGQHAAGDGAAQGEEDEQTAQEAADAVTGAAEELAAA